MDRFFDDVGGNTNLSRKRNQVDGIMADDRPGRGGFDKFNVDDKFVI